MKRVGLWVIGLFVVALFAQAAVARPKYKKVTDEVFKDSKIAELVKEEKCNLCHVKDKDKKIRNDYGAALSKCLTEEKYKEVEKDEAKLTELVKEALKCADGEKSASGATFGELIKEGKDPGTDPKE